MSNRDTLYLDARSDQLWFRRNGNDLVIDIMGSQDANGANPTNAVTIQNHFVATQYQVERIASNDGKVMSAATAETLLNILDKHVEKSGATCIGETSMSGAYQEGVKGYWTSDATVANLITAMAQLAPPAAGTTLTAADYNARISAIYAANVMG